MTDKVKNAVYKALDREYHTIRDNYTSVINPNSRDFIINGKEYIKWFKLRDKIEARIILLAGSTIDSTFEIINLTNNYIDAKVKQSKKQPKKNIQESLLSIKLINRFDQQLKELEHMWDDVYELDGKRMDSESIEYHLEDYCINDLGMKYTPELESLIHDYVTERTKPIYESYDREISDRTKDRFIKIFDREVKAEPLDLYSFQGKFHNIRGLIIALSDYILDRLGSEDDMVDLVIKFVRDYIKTIKPFASDLNEQTKNINRLEQYIYKKLIKKYKFTIAGSTYSKSGWLLICAEKNSNVRWTTNTVIKDMEETYGLPPKLIDKVLFNIENTVYERLNNAKGISKFYVDLYTDTHGLSIIGEGNSLARVVGKGIEIKVDGNRIGVTLKEGNKMITLGRIAVEKKGTGIGRRFIAELKNYADITGKTIAVEQVSNTKFFKQNGFVKEGQDWYYTPTPKSVEQSYLKSKNIDDKLLDLLNKKFANKITLKNWKLIFTEAMDFLYDRIGKENQNRKDYIDMNEFVSKFIYGELESKFGPEWHKLRHI